MCVCACTCMHVCGGGLSTNLFWGCVQAEEGMRRASRGGQLSARQGQAIQGLLSGASRLQRSIQGASRQGGRGGGVLEPLISAAKVHALVGTPCVLWGEGRGLAGASQHRSIAGVGAGLGRARVCHACACMCACMPVCQCMGLATCAQLADLSFHCCACLPVVIGGRCVH